MSQSDKLQGSYLLCCFVFLSGLRWAPSFLCIELRILLPAWPVQRMLSLSPPELYLWNPACFQASCGHSSPVSKFVPLLVHGTLFLLWVLSCYIVLLGSELFHWSDLRESDRRAKRWSEFCSNLWQILLHRGKFHRLHDKTGHLWVLRECPGAGSWGKG